MQDASDKLASLMIVNVYRTQPIGIDTGYVASHWRRNIYGSHVCATGHNATVFKNEVLDQQHLVSRNALAAPPSVLRVSSSWISPPISP
jgi:hypothetical protein